MKKKIEIIYEDDAIVIVNKPPFVLTIPDRYAPEKFNVYHYLLRKYDEIYTVHRLDKETSGILCFAKTPEIHKALSIQFQERTLDKIYLTIIEGNMVVEEGIIDKPIAPSRARQDKMVVSAKGKPSVTEYKVVERFQNFTLMEANIKTGRTHQIRVHFDALGYPLMVDRVYGKREAFFVSEIKRKYNRPKNGVENPLIERTILHAYSLSLNHPVTGERVTFKAPLPKDFRAVVAQLRKWNR